LDKILQALLRSDEATRNERAQRFEWLAKHDTRPSAYSGPVDTLRLMEEARLCFICGHFVAVVLLVTSFVEHTLVDELSGFDLIKGKPTLERLIELGRDNLDLPPGLLERADRVRELRNPFTHPGQTMIQTPSITGTSRPKSTLIPFSSQMRSWP
jgi:hypothetical protein